MPNKRNINRTVYKIHIIKGGNFMSDTLVTVIAIFLAATLMFVFPLMSVSERNDDIAQLRSTGSN